MRSFFFLTLLAWMALVPLTAADSHGDCDAKGYPALGIVEITGGRAHTTAYVDDRNYVLGNGIWIYLESNGIWTPKPAGVYFEGASTDSLQRGGYSCFIPDCGGNEICSDDPDMGPDTPLL